MVMLVMSLTYAASVEEVVSLNNGSCWLQESNGSHNIATFGNSQTLIFGEREKEKIFQMLDANEAFWNFHCSSSGGRIVVNMHKFCAWVAVSMNKISLVSYGRKEYLGANNSRPRDGIQPGSLILEFKGSLQELNTWLHQVPGIEEYVDGAEYLSKNRYQLLLNKNQMYEEPEVREQLEFLFMKEPRVKNLELDYYLHPVGEYYPLSPSAFH